MPYTPKHTSFSPSLSFSLFLLAMSITTLDTAHEDLIHDVAYDFYGKRLVTCSSDQRLKVWDFVEDEEAAVWELNDTWKAHDSSILKAIWAHPEYGQVIASCSFDRQVKIWEELSVEPKNSQKRWAERFRLVESQGAVLDIAFSPIQGALRLATCSVDGMVRVYEALEPTNLAQWSQMEEFEIASSFVPETAKTQQPAHTNSTSSSNSSQASHLDAQPYMPSPFTSNPLNVSQGISPGPTNTLQTGTPATVHTPVDADSGYCIDWCPNRTATALMVVGLGKEIGARIFKHDGHNRWYPAEYLPEHTQEVHDVSWAPSMARSYQLIATACKDHHVRIFKITDIPSTGHSLQKSHSFGKLHSNSSSSRMGHRSFHVELVASLEDHHAEVWRVEWNVTGTILSSSGDDGKLRLWKADIHGQWRQMAVMANTRLQF
ncbi:WD40-repeat-containing domain protein [Spinellus fusiger]|nr:WD40-repeat-containing domain protein [Spinellus fusiger]